MDSIVAGLPTLPPSFAFVCACLTRASVAKFHDTEHHDDDGGAGDAAPSAGVTAFPGPAAAAVGGFVFLRLIMPAILAPTAHGLVNAQPWSVVCCGTAVRTNVSLGLTVCVASPSPQRQRSTQSHAGGEAASSACLRHPWLFDGACVRCLTRPTIGVSCGRTGGGDRRRLPPQGAVHGGGVQPFHHQESVAPVASVQGAQVRRLCPCLSPLLRRHTCLRTRLDRAIAVVLAASTFPPVGLSTTSAVGSCEADAADFGAGGA